MNRRNLLRRHLKRTVTKLGLPATVDFRSFRTMHSSLMSSAGVRPEVTRDNMGHSTVDVTQNVYNRTVGRTSGSCEFSRRQRMAGVYTGPAACPMNVNPFV